MHKRRLWITGIAMVGLVACGEEQAPAPAAQPAKIVSAGFSEPVLNLNIDLGEQGPRDGTLIERAGDEVARIGQDMIAGKPPAKGKIDTINFVVLGPAGPDPAVGRKVAHFVMDAQELRQLANMHANSQGMIESARDFRWWTPANNDVIRDYCASRRSVSFCTDEKS